VLGAYNQGVQDTTTLPSHRDIRLDLVSMNEWRVCDRRFAPDDSRSILGFIERRGFDYEVTSIRHPDTITTHGSLASATSSFSTE
jgi:hypothetical protein